jgi:adenine-specific DNA-methyltransferase
MSRHSLLEDITQALHAFGSGSLEQNAIALFETMGYHSNRRLEGLPLSADNLAETFDSHYTLRADKVLASDWQSVHLLFQLTDDEISDAARERQLHMIFDNGSRVDPSIYRSYIFFALALKRATYTRGQLACITREINRLFPIPVMVLFQHRATLTLAIIHRRLHLRDEQKDVLEKVTLIKDIRAINPHRAHLEILADLSLTELYERHRFTNFLELHQAWQDTLNRFVHLAQRFWLVLPLLPVSGYRCG